MTTIGGIGSGGVTYAATTQRQRNDPMESVAKALGTSTDELKVQLAAGKSLNELADDRGVSRTDLLAAIKAGLPAQEAQAVDSTAVAERIAASQGPPPGQRTGGPQGPPPPKKDESTDVKAVTDEKKLSQLAQFLQMDTADLAMQVTTGTDVISLVRTAGLNPNGLSAFLDSGDLLNTTA